MFHFNAIGHSTEEEKLLQDCNISEKAEAEQDDDLEPTKQHNSDGSYHGVFRASLQSVINGLLAVTVVILLALLITRPPPHRPPTRRPFDPNANDTNLSKNWLSCGHTAAEARSKGCRFDLMMSTWIHADCLDEDLMEEYLGEGNYTWYRDPSFERPMPDEEARLGNHVQIFTRLDFHYSHCAYIWETQLRAYRMGKALPLEAYNYPHTLHCVSLLVEHDIPKNVTTLTAAYDLCGLPDA
jgi:hypothetical protein